MHTKRMGKGSDMEIKLKECWQPRPGNITFSQLASRCLWVFSQEAPQALQRPCWILKALGPELFLRILHQVWRMVESHQIAVFKTFLRYRNRELALPHNHFQPLPQDCQLGLHHHRRVMEVPKAFSPLGLIHLNHRDFLRQVLHHPQASDLRQDLDLPQVKALLQVCQLDFSSQHLQGLGNLFFSKL